MAESNYACPYCGKEITKENVLFWDKTNTQFTDNARGDFLRDHGVKVAAGNKFGRKYYRVKDNVLREDINGFPTMIEDCLNNAIEPENLVRSAGNDRTDNIDEAFDSDDYGDYNNRSGDRQSKIIHNIPSRACPYCHCDLPSQFGLLPTYHVAMFGGRASGKTAYLINLFQQLSQQLSDNNLGSVDLASESDDFLKPMIADYEREGTTRPTAADSGLLPIVCHYRNNDDEAFIIFYDIAGEGTGNAAYMANHKGIANSEALLLMVDPNMFVAGAYYAEWNANHQGGNNLQAGGGDCCTDPLDSFLNKAGMLCREYADNIKYVVCVVTKMDMLMESDCQYFSAGDIEILSDVKEKHSEAIDYNTIKRVNENLNLYLEKKHRIRLKEKLANTFGSDVKLNVLGVSTSTLDAEKTGHGEIHFKQSSYATDSKHRIIEPFLMILMYLSLINVRMPDGRMVRFHAQQPVDTDPVKPEKPGKEEKPKKHGLFGWGK